MKKSFTERALPFRSAEYSEEAALGRAVVSIGAVCIAGGAVLRGLEQLIDIQNHVLSYSVGGVGAGAVAVGGAVALLGRINGPG